MMSNNANYLKCLGICLSCIMVVFRPCSKVGTNWEGDTRGMVPSDRFPCLSSASPFCWQDICEDLGEKAMLESTKSNPCAEWKDSISVSCAAVLIHLCAYTLRRHNAVWDKFYSFHTIQSSSGNSASFTLSLYPRFNADTAINSAHCVHKPVTWLRYLLHT